MVICLVPPRMPALGTSPGQYPDSFADRKMSIEKRPQGRIYRGWAGVSPASSVLSGVEAGGFLMRSPFTNTAWPSKSSPGLPLDPVSPLALSFPPHSHLHPLYTAAPPPAPCKQTISEVTIAVLEAHATWKGTLNTAIPLHIWKGRRKKKSQQQGWKHQNG